MKTSKAIYLFLALMIAAVACVDNSAPEDAFGQGPNLASFVATTSNFSVVATGEEVTQTVEMEVKGPSLQTVTSPVVVNISVDPSSTAIENVHFRLDKNSITLDPENNLLGLLPITVLTEGIQPPLETAPVLVLNVAQVSGAQNVIGSGRKISINLLYLCDSQLQGDYIVTITRSDNANIYVFNETIVKTGDGEYRGISVGHYAPLSLPGTPGFTFLDVCNVITVPEQNLVDFYSNLVYQDGDSYADPVTGNLHIEYTITFAAGNRKYVADYVKQ